MQTPWAGFLEYESGTPPVFRPSLPVSVFGTGARSQVPGAWDPGPDQRRGPNTEHRGPNPTRPAGMHPASEVF